MAELQPNLSAAFCRVLTSGWEEGKGAAEREKEKKEKSNRY